MTFFSFNSNCRCCFFFILISGNLLHYLVSNRVWKWIAIFFFPTLLFMAHRMTWLLLTFRAIRQTLKIFLEIWYIFVSFSRFLHFFLSFIPSLSLSLVISPFRCIVCVLEPKIPQSYIGLPPKKKNKKKMFKLIFLSGTSEWNSNVRIYEFAKRMQVKKYLEIVPMAVFRSETKNKQKPKNEKLARVFYPVQLSITHKLETKVESNEMEPPRLISSSNRKNSDKRTKTWTTARPSDPIRWWFTVLQIRRSNTMLIVSLVCML